MNTNTGSLPVAKIFAPYSALKPYLTNRVVNILLGSARNMMNSNCTLYWIITLQKTDVISIPRWMRQNTEKLAPETDELWKANCGMAAERTWGIYSQKLHCTHCFPTSTQGFDIILVIGQLTPVMPHPAHATWLDSIQGTSMDLGMP